MQNISLIYTTVPTYEDAHRISNILLDNKLIACANIFNNVTSIYLWENEVHNNTECAIILKTTNNLVQDTANKIQEIHPYSTPGIIIMDSINANDKFIQWINDCIVP